MIGLRSGILSPSTPTRTPPRSSSDPHLAESSSSPSTFTFLTPSAQQQNQQEEDRSTMTNTKTKKNLMNGNENPRATGRENNGNPEDSLLAANDMMTPHRNGSHPQPSLRPQQQSAVEDPLANPAIAPSMSQSSVSAAMVARNNANASAYHTHMTEEQLLARLDRFGTTDDNGDNANIHTAPTPRQSSHNKHKNAAATASLLMPTQSASQSASNTNSCSIISGSVATLCSATLGAGILALPYAMAQAGILCGMGLLLASAVATAYSIQLLVQAMQVVYYCDAATSATHPSGQYHHHQQQQEDNPTEEKTYEDLVEICLGTTARRIAEASMLIFCGGGAVSYVIAVGDIVQQSGILQHFIEHDLSPTMTRLIAMSIVWILAMVPLSLLRTMKSLECTSSIGIASITTLVLAALYHYLENHTGHGGDSPDDGNHHHHHPLYEVVYAATSDSRSLFETTDAPDDHDDQSILMPTQGILSILRACPIILFAFSCQVNVCAIYDELKGGTTDASEQDDSEPTGDTNDNEQEEVMTPTTATTDEETPATSPTTTAPTPAARTTASNFTAKFQRMIQVTWLAVGICGLLYTSISIIALLDFGSTDMTPNILSSYDPESVMQVAFIGMALAVVLAYPLNIFPARATVLGMFRARRSQLPIESAFNGEEEDEDEPPAPMSSNNTFATARTAGNATIDLSEPLLADSPSCGSFHSALSVDEHDESTLAVSNVPLERNVIITSFQSSAINDNDNNSDDGLVGHILVTLLLTGASLGLAVVAPNISVVFGLLGGTCTSVMGFILPGLLGYKTANDFYQIDRNEANRGAAARTRALSVLLVIAGVLIGIVTTAVTVYSTFAAPDRYRHNNSILTLLQHHN